MEVFNRILSTPIDSPITLSKFVQNVIPDEYDTFRRNEEEWSNRFIEHFNDSQTKLRLLDIIVNDNAIFVRPAWINSSEEEREIMKHRVLFRIALFNYFSEINNSHTNTLFELVSAWSWHGRSELFFHNPRYGGHGDGGLDFGVLLVDTRVGEMALWGDAKQHSRPINSTNLEHWDSKFRNWVSGHERSDWLQERLGRTSQEFFNHSCDSRASRFLVCALNGFNDNAKSYARRHHVRLLDGTEVIDQFLTAVLYDNFDTLSSFLNNFHVDIESLIEWMNELFEQTIIAE